MLQLNWVTHHAGRGSHGPQSSNQLRRQPCPRSQESGHRSQAPRSPGCCARHCPPPSPPQAALQEETPEARERGAAERRLEESGAEDRPARGPGCHMPAPPRRPPARGPPGHCGWSWSSLPRPRLLQPRNPPTAWPSSPLPLSFPPALGSGRGLRSCPCPVAPGRPKPLLLGLKLLSARPRCCPGPAPTSPTPTPWCCLRLVSAERVLFGGPLSACPLGVPRFGDRQLQVTLSAPPPHALATPTLRFNFAHEP